MNRNKFKSQGRADDQQYEQSIIDLARVTRVMAGGKRMRFRAAVAIGDKKDQVGFGVAKGADVTIAVNKAIMQAKKNLIKSPIVNETIPCKINEKFKAAKILLKPAPLGTGIIAGGAMRQILQLSGIPNVVGKNLGSSNKINVVCATLRALAKLNHFAAKKTAAVKKQSKNVELSLEQK